MASKTWFESFLRDKAEDPVYLTEKLLLNISCEIRRQMREQGITQEELASRLGVSQARVSRMLKPRENITIETMGRIAAALGCSWGEVALCRQPAAQAPGNGKSKIKAKRAPASSARPKKRAAIHAGT